MANPTTNYGWPMPTSSDLVTDLPADFAAFGQPVDTSLKALNPETTLGDISYRSATANTNTRLPIGTSGQVLAVSGGVPAWTTTADVTPLTTKGDLFTFTTVDARLGIGANNTVLTADSSEATGMKWATPGATATSYTLLNSGGTTLSGASTTISSIGGYNKYFITYINATVSASTCSVQFRLNADSTSKYNNIGPYYTIFTAGAVFGQDVNTNTRGALGRAASGQTANGYLLIDGANSSGIKTWFGLGSGETTASQARFFGGVYTGTSVVTSILFFDDFSNSFTGGTVYVYGAN